MANFVKRGDEPLKNRQLKQRALRHYNRSNDRAVVAQFLADNPLNEERNEFNRELAAYRKAVARLDQYILSEGRAEQTEEVPTGELDEEGNPITETVVVAPAIDPLPATVEKQLYDEETGEPTEIKEVLNPDIRRDERQREKAQETVDAARNVVKNFDATPESE